MFATIKSTKSSFLTDGRTDQNKQGQKGSDKIRVEQKNSSI
jgi:hypothetical protein